MYTKIVLTIALVQAAASHAIQDTGAVARDGFDLNAQLPSLHPDQADFGFSAKQWADHYCTRDADNLLEDFTQVKPAFVKQGGPFAESLDLSSDGCSVPAIGTFAIGASHKDNPTGPAELSFLPACERHDFCYRNFKKQNRFNDAEKEVIDEIFRKEKARTKRPADLGATGSVFAGNHQSEAVA